LGLDRGIIVVNDVVGAQQHVALALAEARRKGLSE
jgi:hypothetical protein